MNREILNKAKRLESHISNLDDFYSSLGFSPEPTQEYIGRRLLKVIKDPIFNKKLKILVKLEIGLKEKELEEL